jgi:hypothetical protein
MRYQGNNLKLPAGKEKNQNHAENEVGRNGAIDPAEGEISGGKEHIAQDNYNNPAGNGVQPEPVGYIYHYKENDNNSENYDDNNNIIITCKETD